MDQHYILAAILLIWQGVAATEHALFIRVPRQQPRGIFGEEGYNIPQPNGPPLLEEQRDKREAQEQSLPLQNVFRWFQEQFPNQNRRKAIRQTGQGNLDVPSRQYLPIPSGPTSSTPRPFQPYPSKPSQPFPSQPSQPFPSQPSQPFPSQPSQPFPSQPSQPQYPTDESIPSSPSGPSSPSAVRPYPNQPPTSFPSRPSSTFQPQPAPQPFPSQRPPSFPSTVKPLPSNPPPTHSEDDGHVHPPHIHAIDVTCAKDQMDIRIEFDRVFDGTIYSKGHYNEPACRHVAAGSGQTVYQFTLYLDQCGTRFVDAFSTNEGRAYLENTLVLQNEVGYQEVWDTIRLVQCLWEGNIKQRLTSGLTVGMLDQQVVTFSGDTASTQLDVRVGKFGDGGAGSSATGLVQIGTDMSLVVTIDGDPGFDVQVKECIAKPAGEVTEGLTTTPDESVLRLTDERGCPLKTKIFGAFQKKRGGVGIGGQTSTLYAYAHFQAFKFPDRMDVTIECDVELCKGDCDYCPDVEQNSVGFSARRKRESNSSLSESSLEDLVEAVRMVQHMRVVTPEELSLMSEAGSPSTFINEQRVLHLEPSVCMSRWGFATASILLLSALTASCLVSVSLYIRGWKNQPHILKAQALNYSPNSIGHR